MPLKDIKPLWIVGMVIYLVGLVGYIVGYSRHKWFTLGETLQFGLFRACEVKSDDCVDVADMPGFTYDMRRTGQALTSTGLALLVIAGPLSVFAAVNRKVLLSPVAFCLIFIGDGLGIWGGVHYMIKGHDLLETYHYFSSDWASLEFFVACAVGILSGILLLIAFVRRGRNSPVLRY